MSVIFITGATKNTGYAVAEKFASNGFEVAISSRRTADAYAAATAISEKYGVKAKGYALDMTDTEDIVCA